MSIALAPLGEQWAEMVTDEATFNLCWGVKELCHSRDQGVGRGKGLAR